jgi:hypothetical protein
VRHCNTGRCARIGKLFDWMDLSQLSELDAGANPESPLAKLSNRHALLYRRGI